jgi:hypothetical protein
MSQKYFYAYLLLDPLKPGDFVFTLSDGYTLSLTFEPMYAGKGKGLRSQSHVKEAIYGRVRKHQNAHKLNRINRILAEGLEPLAFVVKSELAEDEAFEIERDLIGIIGRRDLGTGSLTNWSDGGEGVTNLSEETKRKHSEAQMRVRSKMTLAENIYRSLQISETVTRLWNAQTDEQKAQHSNKTRAHWKSLTPKQRIAALAGFRSGYRKWLGSLSEEGRREALGSASKAWWASLTPEQRQEHNQKTSEGLKRTLAARSDEDWAGIRASMSAAQKKRVADMSPAERRAQSAKKREDNDAFLTSLSDAERKAHFAKAREGQRRASVQCPHCPVFHMNKKMMAQYHFENCKHKP